MPNYCNYELKAKGEKENLEKLIEIMNNNYNMSEEDPLHMFRIFEATPTFDNEEKTFLTVRGYCAWSVYSCMMEGACTYYNDFYKGTNATTIDRLAKDLNLYIEIISEEPGMCFMEHIMCYPNGEIIHESLPWYEFDIEDYDTFEKFNKDVLNGITGITKDEISTDINEEVFYNAKKEGQLYITSGGYDYCKDFKLVNEYVIKPVITFDLN